jgi:hypothetical protein
MFTPAAPAAMTPPDRHGDILGGDAVSAFDVGRDRDGYRGHDLADPLDHLGTGQVLPVVAAQRPGDAAAGGRDRLRAGQRARLLGRPFGRELLDDGFDLGLLAGLEIDREHLC